MYKNKIYDIDLTLQPTLQTRVDYICRTSGLSKVFAMVLKWSLHHH